MKTISEFAFIKDGVQYRALAEDIDRVRLVFGPLDCASRIPASIGYYPNGWDPKAHVRMIAIHPEFGVMDRDDLRFAKWLADNGYKALEHEAKPLKDDPDNPCRNTDRNVDALRKRVDRLETASVNEDGQSMHSVHWDRINSLNGRMSDAEQSIRELKQNWDNFVPLNLREAIEGIYDRLKKLEADASDGQWVEVDAQYRLKRQVDANRNLIQKMENKDIRINALVRQLEEARDREAKLQNDLAAMRIRHGAGT